ILNRLCRPRSKEFSRRFPLAVDLCRLNRNRTRQSLQGPNALRFRRLSGRAWSTVTWPDSCARFQLRVGPSQSDSGFPRILRRFQHLSSGRGGVVAPRLLSATAMVITKTVGELFNWIANRIRLLTALLLASGCS